MIPCGREPPQRAGSHVLFAPRGRVLGIGSSGTPASRAGSGSEVERLISAFARVQSRQRGAEQRGERRDG